MLEWLSHHKLMTFLVEPGPSWAVTVEPVVRKIPNVENHNE